MPIYLFISLFTPFGLIALPRDERNALATPGPFDANAGLTARYARNAARAFAPKGMIRCLLPFPVTLIVPFSKSTSATRSPMSSDSRIPEPYSTSRSAASRTPSVLVRSG